MIVAAAVLWKETIFTQPRPARHHDIVQAMTLMGLPKEPKRHQGFLTDDGQFLNRIDAVAHALKAGQIQFLKWPPNLYSEDLW
jgi:hypothetical protein